MYYYSIYIRLIEIFGTIVICDRYIKDTEIDFKLNFPQELFLNGGFGIINGQLKETREVFYLTIPVDESIKRSKMKNEPFPESKEVLEKRLAIYDEFVQRTLLYGSYQWINSIEEIHAQILKELNLTAS